MHIIVTEADIKPEVRTKAGYDMRVSDTTLTPDLISKAKTISFMRRGLLAIMKSADGEQLTAMTRIKAAEYLIKLT